MKTTVYNQQGEETGKQELNPKIFEVPMNANVIHQVVVAQDANSRSVIAHTKQRAEVRGGGRKPWRQKGTGRARHGSIRSPLWRGGGVTFGPTKNRNFSKKVNKKMKRKALFMSLSDKAAHKELLLIDDLKMDAPKTQAFTKILSALVPKVELENKAQDRIKTLIVTPKSDANVILSSRNLPRVTVTVANSLNVKDVLHHDVLIVDTASLEVMEKTFLKSS